MRGCNNITVWSSVVNHKSLFSCEKNQIHTNGFDFFIAIIL